MTPPPTNPPADAAGSRSDSVDLPARRLSLTDFLDVETLQDVQDAFAAVTKLATEIRDADGRPVTRPTDAERRFASDAVLGRLLATVVAGPSYRRGRLRCEGNPTATSRRTR